MPGRLPCGTALHGSPSGPYIIKSFVGEGQYGAVYECMRTDGTKWAVKVLEPDDAYGPVEVRQRSCQGREGG